LVPVPYTIISFKSSKSGDVISILIVSRNARGELILRFRQHDAKQLDNLFVAQLVFFGGFQLPPVGPNLKLKSGDLTLS